MDQKAIHQLDGIGPRLQKAQEEWKAYRGCLPETLEIEQFLDMNKCDSLYARMETLARVLKLLRRRCSILERRGDLIILPYRDILGLITHYLPDQPNGPDTVASILYYTTHAAAASLVRLHDLVLQSETTIANRFLALVDRFDCLMECLSTPDIENMLQLYELETRLKAAVLPKEFDDELKEVLASFPEGIKEALGVISKLELHRLYLLAGIQSMGVRVGQRQTLITEYFKPEEAEQ